MRAIKVAAVGLALVVTGLNFGIINVSLGVPGTAAPNIAAQLMVFNGMAGLVLSLIISAYNDITRSSRYD